MAGIDFNSSDSRTKFLQENLGKLMKGIDSNYSQVMMDELIRRLEKTVSDFNDEVKMMLAKLQGVEEETPSLIDDLPEPEDETPAVALPADEVEDALSAFDKKLQEVAQ